MNAYSKPVNPVQYVTSLNTLLRFRKLKKLAVLPKFENGCFEFQFGELVLLTKFY